MAVVRIARPGEATYYDLPGGAIEAGEDEAQAVAREFAEETGLIVQPEDRLAEAAQYFRKTDGSPVNNAGGFWTARLTGFDASTQCEADHELVWLAPLEAVARLRHEAHAWAMTLWLRSR